MRLNRVMVHQAVLTPLLKQWWGSTSAGVYSRTPCMLRKVMTHSLRLVISLDSYNAKQCCFVSCEKFRQYLTALTWTPWPPKRPMWRCIGSFAHFTDSGRFYMGVCGAFVIVARPQTPAPVPLCLPVCGRALFCMATRKPHFIGTL